MRPDFSIELTDEAGSDDDEDSVGSMGENDSMIVRLAPPGTRVGSSGLTLAGRLPWAIRELWCLARPRVKAARAAS